MIDTREFEIPVYCFISFLIGVIVGGLLFKI